MSDNIELLLEGADGISLTPVEILEGTKKYANERYLTGLSMSISNLKFAESGGNTLCTFKYASSRSNTTYTILVELDGVSLLSKPKQVVDAKTTPVKVSCTCTDYRFVFSYANSLRKGNLLPLQPYVKKTDRPLKNPMHRVGACKHIVGALERLYKIKLLK